MPAVVTRLPAALSEVLDAITVHAETIEFLDHSALSEYDTDDPWTTLSQMYDPLAAGNNCHAATHALDQALVEEIGTPPNALPGTVHLVWTEEADQPVHWANTLDLVGHGVWVLDYTARQFDPTLPFPYVAPLDQWRAAIATAVAIEYGWHTVETHLH